MLFQDVEKQELKHTCTHFAENAKRMLMSHNSME